MVALYLFSSDAFFIYLFVQLLIYISPFVYLFIYLYNHQILCYNIFGHNRYSRANQVIPDSLMYSLKHQRLKQQLFFFFFSDSPIVQCDVVDNDDDHNYRKTLFTSLDKSNGKGLQEQLCYLNIYQLRSDKSHKTGPNFNAVLTKSKSSFLSILLFLSI